MSIEFDGIQMVLPKLEKVKSCGEKWNFKCPICGDGQSGYKTRAWFLKDKTYFFHCFNCDITSSINNFLKNYFPEIYSNYIFEKFKENSENLYIKEKKFDENHKEIFEINKIINPFLKDVNDYPIALKYLEYRNIRSSNDIYICENFKNFKNIEKYKNSNFIKEPRLIIPCYNNKGLISGIVSRALSKRSEKRYINLKFDNNIPLIFGLYDSNGNFKIDLNKKIYVCEGSFDAMSIENGVAVNCSDLLVFDNSIGSNLLKFIDTIYCCDNDRRNIEIINQLNKLIENNKKVFIWPENVHEKDLNKFICVNPDININEFINNNTYQGLQALLMFNQWKKRNEYKRRI